MPIVYATFLPKVRLDWIQVRFESNKLVFRVIAEPTHIDSVHAFDALDEIIEYLKKEGISFASYTCKWHGTRRADCVLITLPVPATNFQF